MGADIAAWHIDLAIPVRALNVLLAGRHIGQLGPSLGGRVPSPQIIQVCSSGGATAKNIDEGAIADPPCAVTRSRARGSGTPRPRIARCWHVKKLGLSPEHRARRVTRRASECSIEASEAADHLPC